ncbi:MAG: hypothetical protein GTO02_09745, partial [Candidatus Dadabacteria bacterium]|nr:hypothetical protein [Candidatus Dadabacteria bacterium]NIQ14658.1 hypothetical protein [Candidatus Dadabacteria bacterium]
MKLFKYFVLAFILAMPVNVFAGGGFTNLSNTDEADSVISAYYDLRDRS